MKDLSFCIFKSDLRSAKALLEADADINGNYGVGIRPIISAINNDNPRVLEFVILNGADVNIDCGQPLYEIIDYCIDGMIQNNIDQPYPESLEMLRILLNNGAELEIKNKKGKCPVDLLFDYGKSVESFEKLKSIFRLWIPQIDELLKNKSQ